MALVFVGFLVNSIVQGFLVDQRVGEQEKIADDIAVAIAPNFADANAAAVYDIAVEYGQDLGGRVLVLDAGGVVQVDSFSKLNGVRLTQDEIEQVRVGNKGAAHGLHKLDIPQDGSLASGGETRSVFVMYYASSIVFDGRMLGVVVLSVPIQDIIDQVGRANAQMQLVFIITCVIVVVVSFWVAHVIAKPIGELTKVIGKMSEGEVHQRVRVTGSSELSRLGAAFNEMSEQLERIEKNRNEFVSDVSHELKTPLSSMKILIESIIYDENVDLARQREFLQDVNREIDRLSSIIDDLLLLVSLDHSQSPMHTGVIRLDQLGESVVKRMQMLAERRGVALSYEAGDEVTVRADELKIQQAFTNLIDNAIKYTPEGGNVDVMVVRREDRAVVCVTDTGFGIPEEDIKHIVERFYRVEKARTRSAGGTGLGLSIVQRIIKMHNGTLEIRSKEGEGTSVVFELPLFTPPQKEE